VSEKGTGFGSPRTRPTSVPLSRVQDAIPLSALERVIDERLSVTATAGRPKRAPRVQFSPLIADAAPTARRTRKIVVAVSIVAHVLVGVVVVMMPKRVQSIVEPALPVEIVFTAEPPRVPELGSRPAPKPAAPKPKPRPEPPREEPPPALAPAPKPPAQPEPVPEIVKAEPPKPRPEVKVGLLEETPSGPGLVASRGSRSAIVVGAGFDGSAGNAATSARPGRVVQTAFEETAARGRGRATTAGTVHGTSFDSEAAAPKKRDAEAPRPPSVGDTEVEILSKPKPVYTEEARALHLEGDVVLDVVFEASGTVRVLDVASGLGHGLDEAAAVAAKKIQFNPAKRDGTPVDHAAKLRVVFRLA